MTVSKIEALVDALARINNAHNPESESYQLRNPLRLRSFAKPGRHMVNSDGLRIFGSYLAGYKGACFDITLKIKGLSRAGLTTTDSLDKLLHVYGFYEKAAIDNIISFVRRALKDNNISAKTPLSYFSEDITPHPIEEF